MPVAVDVGEHRPGRTLARTSDSRRIGNIGEFPVAQVAIKRVGSVKIAKVDIAPAVPVVITQSHTGTVQQVGVGHNACFRQNVGKLDSAGRGRAKGKAGFTLVPASTSGIQFSNILPEARIMANANLLNGSGVALGDYDGDGWCDIYLCDLNGRNALFRNLGNWKFTNVTDAAGVACPGQSSTGAVFADINGDGHLDLLGLSMGGPNACFLNEGQGHFTNVTATAGLTSRLGSTSMALADIDGNGTLDLYVANYGATSLLRSGGARSRHN